MDFKITKQELAKVIKEEMIKVLLEAEDPRMKSAQARTAARQSIKTVARSGITDLERHLVSSLQAKLNVLSQKGNIMSGRVRRLLQKLTDEIDVQLGKKKLSTKQQQQLGDETGPAPSVAPAGKVDKETGVVLPE